MRLMDVVTMYFYESLDAYVYMCRFQKDLKFSL